MRAKFDTLEFQGAPTSEDTVIASRENDSCTGDVAGHIKKINHKSKRI